MAEEFDPTLKPIQTSAESSVRPPGSPQHDHFNPVEVSILGMQNSTTVDEPNRSEASSSSAVANSPENTRQDAAGSISREEKELTEVGHQNSTSQIDLSTLPPYIMVLNDIESGLTSYHCKICKRQFRDVSRIVFHEYCAGKEKPYKCEECGKRTLRKRDHDRHLKTHADEQVFQCQYCEQSFDLKRKLNNHIKSHALRMNAEQHPIYKSYCPLKCHICEVVAFREKVDLKNHLVNGHNIAEDLAETLTNAVVANTKPCYM
ncbi:unnamed protein product [Orchesella dallaii]|uniref:C2H2-type domain-containing protein n=1 Tax=Orchesella dallaii TaxID=48710 RepID=A0ABP1S0J2_9HEXA